MYVSPGEFSAGRSSFSSVAPPFDHHTICKNVRTTALKLYITVLKREFFRSIKTSTSQYEYAQTKSLTHITPRGIRVQNTQGKDCRAHSQVSVVRSPRSAARLYTQWGALLLLLHSSRKSHMMEIPLLHDLRLSVTSITSVLI